jgi:hypothetical protein
METWLRTTKAVRMYARLRLEKGNEMQKKLYGSCLGIHFPPSLPLSLSPHAYNNEQPLLWISDVTPLLWVVKFHPKLEVVLQKIKTFFGLCTSPTCTFKLVETLLLEINNTFILQWYKGIIMTLEDIRILCPLVALFYEGQNITT